MGSTSRASLIFRQNGKQKVTCPPSPVPPVPPSPLWRQLGTVGTPTKLVALVEKQRKRVVLWAADKWASREGSKVFTLVDGYDVSTCQPWPPQPHPFPFPLWLIYVHWQKVSLASKAALHCYCVCVCVCRRATQWRWTSRRQRSWWWTDVTSWLLSTMTSNPCVPLRLYLFSCEDFTLFSFQCYAR